VTATAGVGSLLSAAGNSGNFEASEILHIVVTQFGPFGLLVLRKKSVSKMLLVTHAGITTGSKHCQLPIAGPCIPVFGGNGLHAIVMFLIFSFRPNSGEKCVVRHFIGLSGFDTVLIPSPQRSQPDRFTIFDILLMVNLGPSSRSKLLALDCSNAAGEPEAPVKVTLHPLGPAGAAPLG
jgi:hypothetical protein